jgi:hypothetical protein
MQTLEVDLRRRGKKTTANGDITPLELMQTTKQAAGCIYVAMRCRRSNAMHKGCIALGSEEKGIVGNQSSICSLKCVSVWHGRVATCHCFSIIQCPGKTPKLSVEHFHSVDRQARMMIRMRFAVVSSFDTVGLYKWRLLCGGRRKSFSGVPFC